MLTQEKQSKLFRSDSSPLFGQDNSSKARNARRMVAHKEVEFSSQSIMKAMESFVEAVREMEQTILVPSRLMDLEVGDSAESAGLREAGDERDNLGSTDLFRLYNMVNTVRQELLWGGGETVPEETTVTPAATDETTVVAATGSAKPARRPSVGSLASSQSLSDTDSETGNENDSGIEAEGERKKPDYACRLEEGFRRHLAGLSRSLSRMTAAAHYLTSRYQSDISGGM